MSRISKAIILLASVFALILAVSCNGEVPNQTDEQSSEPISEAYIQSISELAPSIDMMKGKIVVSYGGKTVQGQSGLYETNEYYSFSSTPAGSALDGVLYRHEYNEDGSQKYSSEQNFSYENGRITFQNSSHTENLAFINGSLYSYSPDSSLTRVSGTGIVSVFESIWQEEVEDNGVTEVHKMTRRYTLKDNGEIEMVNSWEERNKATGELLSGWGLDGGDVKKFRNDNGLITVLQNDWDIEHGHEMPSFIYDGLSLIDAHKVNLTSRVPEF